jgi:hypothetical protein
MGKTKAIKLPPLPKDASEATKFAASFYAKYGKTMKRLAYE